MCKMQIAFAYNLWLYFTAATNPDTLMQQKKKQVREDVHP